MLISRTILSILKKVLVVDSEYQEGQHEIAFSLFKVLKNASNSIDPITYCEKYMK